MDSTRPAVRGYRNWILADGTLVPMISGGDGDEPTALPEIPTDLEAMTDEELTGLHGELEAAYQAIRAADGARTRAQVDTLREVRAKQALLVKEASDRIERNNELNELDGSAPALPTAETEAEPTPGGELIGAGVGAGTAPVTAAAGAPVVVSAADVIDNRPGMAGPPAAARKPGVVVPMVAAMTADGGAVLGTGAEFDFEQLGYMIEREKQGMEGRFQLAKIAGFDGTSGIEIEPLRNSVGVEVNDRLMREAREDYVARNPKLFAHRTHLPAAHTAAICDPLDIIREIPNCTQATEPFSDSLPQRPAGRLGFQYTPAMSLSTVSAGVADWTETNQAAVDPTNSATWKPCVLVSCPTPVPVRAEAIAACMYFDITTDMSNPERIQDAMNKITAYKARVKTARLLQIAEGFSSRFSFVGPYGALPDFVHMVLTVLAQAMYAERLDDAPYNLYLPPGLLEDLVIDRANRAYNPLTSAESADVIAYIESEARAGGHAVQVIQLADVSATESAPFPALPPADGHAYPLPSLGGTAHPFRVHLIAPESALYFSTGEINTGIERSPDLMRRNQAQWFMEEFVGLAKPGCHPWFWIDATLCNSGARAGLTTPYSCPGAPS